MTTPMLVRVAKSVLWWAALLVSLWWLALRFFFPTPEGKVFRKETVRNGVGQTAFLGRNAVNYVLFSCPIIALAIFALLYLELERNYPTERSCVGRRQWWLGRFYRAMWTQPLVVRSPLGILTGVDILGIVVVLVCVVWVWGKSMSGAFDEIDSGEESEPGVAKWKLQMKMASATLGAPIPFTTALLFLPVTRGSPILRLLDVPFEQAVRYHRWIGNLTMVLVTLHGVTYAIYAGAIQELSLLAEWKYTGISNLAGVVSLIAGILLWVTSIALVRRRYFDFFFGMHHFYLAFFIFYAFHVGWGHMGNDMGPIFLFFVDRFLRMIQSRREVAGACARVLPNGNVELKLPKDKGFRATPLSFLYISIPKIAPNGWHPFSFTSSPFQGSVTMIIKPLGDWTHNLQATTLATPVDRPSSSFCPFREKVHVEGPYGHESNYYLRYNNLVLIAGGVGVTPFLAIIRDLLIRCELHQRHLPSNVHLIWCVKRSSELVALQEICPAQIYPGYAFEDPRKLTLTVHAYVTSEQQLDNTSLSGPLAKLDTEMEELDLHTKEVASGNATANVLSGFSANANLWLLAIILFSVAGFVVMSGLFHQFVVATRPKDKPILGAVEVIFFFMSLMVGIVLCGGSVIQLWLATRQMKAKKKKGKADGCHDSEMAHHLSLLEMQNETLLQTCAVTKHTRPNFKDVLSGVARKHAGEEIGVLVSGVQGLHESVALACRSLNFSGQSEFHLHSVSFDL